MSRFCHSFTGRRNCGAWRNCRKRSRLLYTALNSPSLIFALNKWDWFDQSCIRPLYNFLTQSFINNSISPILNLPSWQRAKIKRGRNFPLYSIHIACTNLVTWSFKCTIPWHKSWRPRNKWHCLASRICHLYQQQQANVSCQYMVLIEIKILQIWPWSRFNVNVIAWYHWKGIATRIEYECFMIDTPGKYSQSYPNLTLNLRSWHGISWKDLSQRPQVKWECHLFNILEDKNLIKIWPWTRSKVKLIS